MTKPKTERTIATLQRCLKESGNVTLREAIDVLEANKKPPPADGLGGATHLA
jgi:hypothetical protein